MPELLKPTVTEVEKKQDPNAKTVETTEEHQEESRPSHSEHETRAASLGWMPKEEWVASGKPESDWKPAKVFLDHGDMIGKIRSQNRELDEMRKALSFANNQNTQVFEKGYQQALVELRQERRAALAAGDLVKADEIDERIDATKDQITKIQQNNAALARAAAPKQPQVDPEHLEWVQQNSWYNTDKTLAKFADAEAVRFIEENAGNVTAAQVRKHVEQEVRKEFPERTGNTRPKAAPSPDGDSSRGATGRNSTSSLDSKLSRAKSEMTDEQRSIMKTIMKSTGMSEKKYLELYSQ